MIQGVDTDAAGRCTHWAGPSDVVATEFPCCTGWWACHACHDDASDHKAEPWPKTEQHRLAVLCGACHARVAIEHYLARTDDACPHCGHAWNPDCRRHQRRYFA